MNFLRQPYVGMEKKKRGEEGGEKIPGPGERKFLFTLRCVSLAYRRKVHALTMEKTRQRSNLPGRGGEGGRGEEARRKICEGARVCYSCIFSPASALPFSLGAPLGRS